MIFIGWLHWMLNYLITAIAVRAFQMLFPETHLGVFSGVIH